MTGARETAAQLDSAIDSLLREPNVPRAAEDGELAATARVLRDALPRLHPRFSFEELLAVRLAAARRLREAASHALPTPEPTPIGSAVPAAIEPAATNEAETAERRRRGLVAGGAIASGVSLALPIAGAAIVVWRRSRSSGGIL